MKEIHPVEKELVKGCCSRLCSDRRFLLGSLVSGLLLSIKTPLTSLKHSICYYTFFGGQGPRIGLTVSSGIRSQGDSQVTSQVHNHLKAWRQRYLLSRVSWQGAALEE